MSVNKSHVMSHEPQSDLRPGVVSDAAFRPRPHPEKAGHSHLRANAHVPPCLPVAQPGVGSFNPSGVVFPSVK